MRISLLLILLLLFVGLRDLYGKDYYVATENPVASDANSGTEALPLKTIDAARNLVRLYIQNNSPLHENIVVWIRKGTYELTSKLNFLAADSGSAQYQILYQGYPGEKVVISGKKTILASSFQTVLSSDPHWAQIDNSAKNILVSVNLKNLGITVDNTPYTESDPCQQLFINDLLMPMSRWPDIGEQRVGTVLANTFNLVGTVTPAVTGEFIANGTADGITAYKRKDLLGGDQYYLYRMYWNYLGTNYRAWFLNTVPNVYPSGTKAFWHSYTDLPMSLTPGVLATGTLKPTPNLISESFIENGFIAFQNGDTTTSFYFLSDRIQRWTLATDMMIHGFMFWLWADNHAKVQTIDFPNRKITLTAVPGYGIDDTHNGRLFVYNLIEEITKPGEWYLDKVTGVLYIWPTTGFNKSKIAISNMVPSQLQLTNTKYVKFKNLSFDGGRGNCIEVFSGQGIDFDGIELLNSGLDALGLSECTQSSVQNSLISGAGKNGIWTYNKSWRPALTPSNLFIQNCEFIYVGQWKHAYSTGVNMYYGVNNNILNNEFHDFPHTAILYTGNENNIFRNKIYNVCSKTSDAGAIYTGRDWGYRGNLIKNNFIYNVISEVGKDVNGIYFDDAVAANSAVGNILFNIKGDGVQHGGGRDIVMKGNIFYKCRIAYALDDRGRKFINNVPNDTWNFLNRLTNDGIDYKAEPWKSKYPLLYAIPNDWAQLSNPVNKWFGPGGSIVTSNIGFQNDRFLTEYASVIAGESVIAQLQEYSNNVEDVDPLFKDKDQLDFELLPNSPALKIPGFENIPFRKIGLFKNTYSTITASAGSNGHISPAGNISIKYGLSQTYTITPTNGYDVEGVLIDNVNVGPVLSYVFSNVITEHTISVTFKIKNFIITSSAGVNGSISPLGNSTVSFGASQAYVITPAIGFDVLDVIVNAVSLGALSSYTFSNVSANHSIAVTFKAKTKFYNITSSAGSNGSITPLGVQAIAENSNLSFTITPNSGYQIATLLIDGVSVSNSNTYEFSNVTADHQIAVTFSLIVIEFSITSSTSAGGTILPLGKTIVGKGQGQVFTITPDAGYSIENVLVDGVSQGKIGSYAFVNIIADRIISVAFKKDEVKYKVTASVEGSGTISPNGETSVLEGGSQSYAIVANSGFEIQSVFVDNVNVGKVSTYLFANVVAAHSIKAVFVATVNSFTIISSASNNGLISPSGSLVFPKGNSASFSFIPNTNYQVSDVKVDGVSQGVVSFYDFSNVQSDHTIEVSFSEIILGSKKELLEFSFNDLKTKGLGIINDNLVSIVVPTGTDLSALVATYRIVGSKVLVNGNSLLSGVTKINFQEPVSLIIVAEDGSQKKYTVTVFEAADIPAGMIGFEHSSYSFAESTGKAVVVVNRFGGTKGVVKVKYETLEISAKADSDFIKVSGELIWQDSESASKTIEITFVSDAIEESDETFSVRIVSIEGGLTGNLQRTEVVIRNLDSGNNGAAAGGCCYVKEMPYQDQAGNLVLMFFFLSLILFKRQIGPSKRS